MQSEELRKSAEKRVTEEEQTQMLRENQAILKEKSKHLKALRSGVERADTKSRRVSSSGGKLSKFTGRYERAALPSEKREFFAINYGDASSRACNAAKRRQ